MLMNSYEQKISHHKKPNKIFIQSEKNEFILQEKSPHAFISKLSPIRVSDIDKFKKQDFQSNNQISAIDADLHNKSCEARVRRYASKKSLDPDPMFHAKPQPPSEKAPYITSVSNNDSHSHCNPFFSQQASINSSTIQSSLNGSSIGTNDNSLLNNSLLNSEKKSQRSIKSTRKLKLSSNQIWLNLLRDGINNLNSTDKILTNKSGIVSIRMKDNKQNETKINNNFRKNFENIKLDKFEKSTDSNDCKNINMLNPLINLKCSSLIDSPDHDCAILKDLESNCSSQNSISISKRNIRKRINMDLFNRIQEKMTNKVQSQKQNHKSDRCGTENSYMYVNNTRILDHDDNDNDRKEILIAKNYIEAPLPKSKLSLKVMSDKYYSNTIEKLQKTKHLFTAFKLSCEEYDKQLEMKKLEKSAMKENFNSSNQILEPIINNNISKKSNDKDSLLLVNKKYDQLCEKNIRIGVNIILRVLKKKLKSFLYIITYNQS